MSRKAESSPAYLTRDGGRESGPFFVESLRRLMYLMTSFMPMLIDDKDRAGVVVEKSDSEGWEVGGE